MVLKSWHQRQIDQLHIVLKEAGEGSLLHAPFRCDGQSRKLKAHSAAVEVPHGVYQMLNDRVRAQTMFPSDYIPSCDYSDNYYSV
jgi:hypothetical protein